ncbi:MAG: hypothetical protein R3B70_03650 [Polyangiaceae bacterium]
MTRSGMPKRRRRYVSGRAASWPRGEGLHAQLVYKEGRVDEGGVDPEEGLLVVGVVGGALREAAGGLGDGALDATVDVVDAAGGAGGLFEIAEDHGEDVVEGALEAAERVCLGGGVLIDGVSDEGVGCLQEGGAAPAEEEDGLAVDGPREAVGAEDACARVRHGGAEIGEHGLQIVARYGHSASPFGAACGLSVARCDGERS